MDFIEGLSYIECFQKVDINLLTQQLKNISENSLFYIEKYNKLGLDIKLITNLNTFSSLPFTDKDEIISEQHNYPPFGRLSRNVSAYNLRRVHVTSGSTGKPIYIVLTENDLIATVEAGRRAFLCAGITPGDTIIHCLNYSLWAGGLTDHMSLEATGATVIPFGVGNSKNLIHTIVNLKPTAISCTPSYLSRLEYLLEEEFQIAPQDLGLKKAFLGGEGGLQDPDVRFRIESIWKMSAIDANYGMADVLSIFGSECRERNGLHFHGQGILFFELIDPINNSILPVKSGQIGEMVLTNLRREAQPLVRFRTRDLVKIVSTDECLCGRKSFRFLVIGRTDDMIVVRGINVFPNAVANLLAKNPEWFSGEFEFLLDSPPPIDRPLLRVELGSRNAMNNNVLQTYLIQKCHEDLNFTPRLEFIRFGEFPRTEGKTRRVRKTF